VGATFDNATFEEVAPQVPEEMTVLEPVDVRSV
jgi:hypothetical protein